MIAQWDSSLSVLPVARVMIAQWDSSLSALPVARVMIAQWDSSLSVHPVARVQFPAMAEYFKGFFPGWSHSSNPSWASVAENGSISPQWVTFSMGHASASRKSPNDAPWETLSLRLRRPISAPLLTVARSWRHKKKLLFYPHASIINVLTSKPICSWSHSLERLHIDRSLRVQRVLSNPWYISHSAEGLQCLQSECLSLG